MIGTTLFAGLALMQQPKCAAFENAKQMIGNWEGTVGGGLPLHFEFHMIQDGKGIEANGMVGDPKKPVLQMHTRFGIDPRTNKMYYLDCHNTDTVYFGTCEVKGDGFSIDFKSIVGTPEHYYSTCSVVKDTYKGTIAAYQPDGSLKELHGVELKRSK